MYNILNLFVFLLYLPSIIHSNLYFYNKVKDLQNICNGKKVENNLNFLKKSFKLYYFILSIYYKKKSIT